MRGNELHQRLHNVNDVFFGLADRNVPRPIGEEENKVDGRCTRWLRRDESDVRLAFWGRNEPGGAPSRFRGREILHVILPEYDHPLVQRLDGVLEDADNQVAQFWVSVHYPRVLGYHGNGRSKGADRE